MKFREKFLLYLNSKRFFDVELHIEAAVFFNAYVKDAQQILYRFLI